jgi:hypothetical protein
MAIAMSFDQLLIARLSAARENLASTRSCNIFCVNVASSLCM